MFAFCDESGLAPEIKREVVTGAANGTAWVRTDPRASPTGYPFKVVQIEGHERDYARRERCCDLGYLREAYRMENGRLNYKCAAEPVNTWVAKGFDEAETVGRRCLCNGLMADIGLPQLREDGPEPAVVTSGDDIASIVHLARDGRYSAADVLAWLQSGLALREAPADRMAAVA
jgi:nitronate monooxygenase